MECFSFIIEMINYKINGIKFEKDKKCLKNK